MGHNIKCHSIIMTYLLKVKLFLIITTLFSIISYAQPNNISSFRDSTVNNKLEITGTLPGLVEGEVVYLSKYFVYNEDAWIDSTHVKNGKFIFSHTLNDGPRLFQITFLKHRKFLTTAFGNERVSITSTLPIDKIPSETIVQWVRIDGSDIANDFMFLDFAISNMWLNPINSIDNSILKFKDSSYSKDKLEHILGLMEAKSYISRHVQNMLTDPFYATRKLTPEFYTEFHSRQLMYDSLWVSAYARLDNETKNSYNGQIMKDNLYLCVGQPAPDFSFVNQNGETNTLKKVVEKNKLTILNFWSSKADRRIQVHKELFNAYKKYQKKGFEIVGVSLDGTSDRWRKMILNKIAGLQTADFRIPAQLYKVDDPKFPVSVLIDENGKILAWDTDGPELFGYLYRIFKE